MRSQFLSLCAGLFLATAPAQLDAASIRLSPLGDQPVGQAGIPNPSLELRDVSSGPNDQYSQYGQCRGGYRKGPSQRVCRCRRRYRSDQSQQ